MRAFVSIDKLIDKWRRVRDDSARLFAQLVVQSDILQDNLKITQDLLAEMHQELNRRPSRSDNQRAAAPLAAPRQGAH